MDKITFLGNAWSDDYGISVALNYESLKKAIADGELEINKYGDVRIRVQKMKNANIKTKATHFVSVPTQKPDSPF